MHMHMHMHRRRCARARALGGGVLVRVSAGRWLGVNTINVNGKTTTLVGSSFWGLEVVEALRDHMEGTLREIMAQAPRRGGKEVPAYGAKK